MPERQRRVPVQRGRCPGHVLRPRIGHHVRGGVGDPAREGGRCRESGRATELVPLAGRQDHVVHRASSGISMRRPSRADRSPSSASCTPRAPAVEVPRERLVLDDVAQERLPLDLEAVVEVLVVGHLLPLVAEALGGRQVRVPHRLRRAARCCSRQRRRPATAEPWVPSTWNSTSSSRCTRTAQDELICATIPPSSSKMAYAASSAVASYSTPCSSTRRGMWVAVTAVTARTGPNSCSST